MRVMKKIDVEFKKGLVGDDEILHDGIPQVAFIGRSNVGKSSLVNLLTKSSVSRTSSFPGRTQEINVFLVNKKIYLLDLPGYGYARTTGAGREKIGDLIENYLFNEIYQQKKIVFIIDATVGMTDNDLAFLMLLKKFKKDFVIVANKVDRMNQSEYHKSFTALKKQTAGHTLIPFSTKDRTGLETLTAEIFN